MSGEKYQSKSALQKINESDYCDIINNPLSMLSSTLRTYFPWRGTCGALPVMHDAPATIGALCRGARWVACFASLFMSKSLAFGLFLLVCESSIRYTSGSVLWFMSQSNRLKLSCAAMLQFMLGQYLQASELDLRYGQRSQTVLPLTTTMLYMGCHRHLVHCLDNVKANFDKAKT